jgi:excinuclease ABC subunit C
MASGGLLVIKNFLVTLPLKPGVYRMISKEGKVLYVGKAKNLRSRVTSYTHPEALPVRLRQMIYLTHSMEFVVTQSESEALILEATLIKKFQPAYNVRLKDDKAYPYILLTKGELPPRLTIYRGAVQKQGEYFGPFASVSAVHDTMELLIKTFKLRTCKDTVYRHRKRPCLQYYIKRCSGPCVGKIAPESYAQSVEQVHQFLKGKTSDIQKVLREGMLAASANLDFEQAALYRDQIQSLNRVQKEQGLRLDALEETDVIVLVKDQGIAAIQVFFFRHGWNYGNQSYFPTHDSEAEESMILEKFIMQFYLDKPIPKELLTNIPLVEEVHGALEEVAKTKVHIGVPKRGDKKQLVAMALHNARESLARHLAHKSSQTLLLEGVKSLFELENSPERIEVYDNSHTQGTMPYGAMIVATPQGFDKKSYRVFSIKNQKQADLAYGGDDYAMMEEVLVRRFSNKEIPLPDLVLLDGGKGQLSVGEKVFKALEIGVPLVAISKGVDRNAGRETFHQINKEPFQLPTTDPVLYYLQRLRDEAHRFAIGTHRKGRDRNALQSSFQGVEGIGPKRRRALLEYFGTFKDIQQASIQELQKVEGISEKIATSLYHFFRPA